MRLLSVAAMGLAAAAGGLALIRPATAATPAAAPVERSVTDTSAASRDSMMNAVLAQIRGRGQLPAESVFKNITILKGRPAAAIPRIMNGGFGRSLGVGCEHCHNINDWASDEKAQKEVARDMWAMVSTINTQLLANIRNIGGNAPAIVNCTTCHRGDVKPAIEMPPIAPPR